MTKSQVGGQLLAEAKYINLSLHFLEQVSSRALAREKNVCSDGNAAAWKTCHLRRNMFIDFVGKNTITTIKTRSMKQALCWKSNSIVWTAEMFEAVTDKSCSAQTICGREAKSSGLLLRQNASCGKCAEELQQWTTEVPGGCKDILRIQFGETSLFQSNPGLNVDLPNKANPTLCERKYWHVSKLRILLMPIS